MTPDDEFMCRLALALGKTVSELKSTLTMKEARQWAVFEQSNPFPADLIDIHGALLCSTMINMWSSGDGQASDLNDYLLLRRKPSKEETEGEGTEAERLAAQLRR